MPIKLTPRIVAYVAHNEAIVPEAYKDAKGIWTWGMGLAATGGYDIMKYKDKEASIVACLRAAIDALNHDYLPGVIKAFEDRNLNEGQVAAAMSFHWNTHAIGRANWVKDFLVANLVQGEKDLRNNYTGEGLLQARRNSEADLFFKGKWPSNFNTLIYEVSKPSYTPKHARVFDPLPTLEQIMNSPPAD